MKTKKNLSSVLSIMSVVGISLLLLFTASHFQLTGSETVKPPEKNRMKPDHAPTPFSAAEIRDGCPNGRTIKHRIEMAGKPDTFRVFTFINGDRQSTSFQSMTLDMAGKQVEEKQTARAKWEELRTHASFPQAMTQISTESYTTPAGTFDCWLYVVTLEKEGKKDVKRFWFAKSLPGPPICFEQTVNGKQVFRMTLVENTQ
jgi:hypothetical protein